MSGTIENLDFATYRAAPGVNWSTLKHARKSLLHYHDALSAPSRKSSEMALGTAVHTAILEPSTFKAAVYPGPVRRGKEWDAFRAENIGATILTAQELCDVDGMATAVHAHGDASLLLASGLAERSLFWTDEATGIECKCRVDWLAVERGFVLDLKTAREVGPRLFARAAMDLGYAGQMAYALRGLRAITGRDFLAFIVAVESSRPHDVATYRLPARVLEVADAEIDLLLMRVKECSESGQWPGQVSGIVDLDMPHWFYPSDEDGDATDGLTGWAS